MFYYENFFFIYQRPQGMKHFHSLKTADFFTISFLAQASSQYKDFADPIKTNKTVSFNSSKITCVNDYINVTIWDNLKE